MKKHYDRIYASINLDAISHNMDNIANLLSFNTKIISVVKTDAKRLSTYYIMYLY